MKRKLLILSVLLICAATVTVGTLAFFTAEDTAHNVITSGGVNIRLVEKTKGEDGVLIDFPDGGLTGIMPGTEASKIVSVQNTGASEAWIRVTMELEILSADGNPLPNELQVDGMMVAAVTPNVEQDWLDGGDGYYYYRYPVAPEDSTANFLETVRFAPEMGNEYQDCTVLLTVSAQAVQTANNPIPADGDVRDVTGWPAD